MIALCLLKSEQLWSHSISLLTASRYLYWAKITREEEKGISGGIHPLRRLFHLAPKEQLEQADNIAAEEKEKEFRTESPNGNGRDLMNVSTEEWVQASRALRT